MRILAILAALLVPLAVYFPVYEQREKAIESADKEISELDKHIEQARAAQRKLPQFREEVQRLNVEVVKLRRILPADPSLQDVRNLVDATARTASLRIERFQPRATTRHEYVEVSVDTETVGSIEAVASFFDALRNKFRIINASDVTVRKEGAGLWRAKFLLTTHALPD